MKISKIFRQKNCIFFHQGEPKKHEKNKKDNVIDFLSYLKKKRDEEIEEQLEQDPF